MVRPARTPDRSGVLRLRRELTLRRLGPVLVLVGLLVAAPAVSARGRGHCEHARTPIVAATHGELDRAVVCLVNRRRRGFGLPPLKPSPRLDRSAQGWTDFMVAHGDFSHGSNFGKRLTAVGFHWSRAGENIATGFPTAASVIRAWMASAGHCRNILAPTFGDLGVGVSARGIGDAGSGTWTQDFGLRLGARAPSGDWGPADGCPY
jgi:uncharacterized protein YkwD